MAEPCPICGATDCSPHFGQGTRRLFQTEQEKLGGGKVLRLTKRLYLNGDRTKVVEHGDPDAAFLLGAGGALISEQDAKRLGVKDTEEVKDFNPNQLIRAQVAAVPMAADDDSLYDDQSERGKAARAAAREQQRAPIAEYVLSTGGTEEEAERAALEASGQAAPTLPTADEQKEANATLVGGDEDSEESNKPRGRNR